MSRVLHNKQLRRLIEQSTDRVHEAVDTADLLEVIKGLKAFGRPLAFDNTTPKVLCCIGVLLIAAAFLFVPIVVFGIAFLLGGWLVMDRRSGAIDVLCKAIIRRSSLFTYGLSVTVGPDESVLESLAEEFQDFHRGNYSREILRIYEGTSSGAVHELPFTYQQLKYVDRETRTTTVSDGKGGTKQETRTVYETYYRYSLVLEFPWVTNVVVRGDRHRRMDLDEALDTASGKFNRAFHLTGATQMACAVFAKPATVLHLLQLSEELSYINLEFSADGQLCVSFSDNGLLTPEQNEGFKDLQAFEKLIQAGVQMPCLDFLLSWVHRLAEMHDDNFALSPKKLSPKKPSRYLEL